MTLSEYQKKLIIDNPTLTNEQLSKLVDCGITTVKDYRKKIREGKMKPPVVKGQNSVQEATPSPARNNNTPSEPSSLYTPTELAVHMSEMCRSERELYKMAEKHIQTHGAEPKVVWDLSQHLKNFNMCATNLGRWFGMEKLTLNTGKAADITKDDMDKMTDDQIEEMMAECLRNQ